VLERLEASYQELSSCVFPEIAGVAFGKLLPDCIFGAFSVQGSSFLLWAKDPQGIPETGNGERRTNLIRKSQ
jgi:hypothetical protein